jgi:hypothetical protein
MKRKLKNQNGTVAAIGHVVFASNDAEVAAYQRQGYVEVPLRTFQKGNQTITAYSEVQEHVFLRDGFSEVK